MTTSTTTAGDPGSELLSGALALAARGWHLFPLRHDDKRPAIADWENRATADPGRITAAWQAGGPYAGCGIGLACGPSGLVVVDLDTAKHDQDTPPEAWALPGVVDGADVLAALYGTHGDPMPFGTTPWARTGSGGDHLYFRAPTGRTLRNSAGKVGWKIDVRAAGGYVVAPPSTVAGRPYTWEFGTGPGTGLADLPAWLLDLAAPLPRPAAPAPRRTGPAPKVSRTLGGLLRVVAEAHEGERNSRLYWASCKAFEHARAGHLDDTTAASCLLDAAVAAGLDDREARTTITSAHRATNGRSAA